MLMIPEQSCSELIFELGFRMHRRSDSKVYITSAQKIGYHSVSWKRKFSLDFQSMVNEIVSAISRFGFTFNTSYTQKTSDYSITDDSRTKLLSVGLSSITILSPSKIDLA